MLESGMQDECNWKTFSTQKTRLDNGRQPNPGLFYMQTRTTHPVRIFLIWRLCISPEVMVVAHAGTGAGDGIDLMLSKLKDYSKMLKRLPRGRNDNGKQKGGPHLCQPTFSRKRPLLVLFPHIKVVATETQRKTSRKFKFNFILVVLCCVVKVNMTFA